MLGGVSAANAATGSSWYCGVEAKTPVLSSTRISGTGSAWSCSGAQLKLYVQLKRSEGWTHPTVAQVTQAGPYTSFGPLTARNCDPGGSHVYFTQSFMQANTTPGSVVISSNSSSLNPCDSI